MAKFLATKSFGALRPVGQDGEDALAKIKQGATVSIEVKQPRNVQHHRKYWALVNLVHQNLPEADDYPEPDNLHQALKVAAGLRTPIIIKGKTVAYLPGSIAFHKMDQAAFGEFYDRVCDLVAEHFIPGIEVEALKREVEEIIGVRRAA